MFERGEKFLGSLKPADIKFTFASVYNNSPIAQLINDPRIGVLNVNTPTFRKYLSLKAFLKLYRNYKTAF